MEERVRYRPFTGDSERRVSINNPPLALVLVQVRWPEHGMFTRDFRTRALDFGDQLADFPLFDEVPETGVQITPEGVTSITGQTAYRWRSTDDVWGINLTKRFVSLYCTRHEAYSFSELQNHLGTIMDLLDSQLQVKSVESTGIRYVNRISDTNLMETIDQVFQPAVLGYFQLKNFGEQVKIKSSFNQAIYDTGEVALNVRSGLLSPGETPDPIISPESTDTWVLDLNAVVENQKPYDATETGETIGKLADAVYDFFKLVLRDGAEDKLDGVE